MYKKAFKKIFLVQIASFISVQLIVFHFFSERSTGIIINKNKFYRYISEIEKNVQYMVKVCYCSKYFAYFQCSSFLGNKHTNIAFLCCNVLYLAFQVNYLLIWDSQEHFHRLFFSFILKKIAIRNLQVYFTLGCGV